MTIFEVEYRKSGAC